MKHENLNSPVLLLTFSDLFHWQALTSSTAEAQLSSAVPFTPGSSLDSSSSPLREELQTVPVFKQNPSQETKLTISVAAPTEACTVPQR